VSSALWLTGCLLPSLIAPKIESRSNLRVLALCRLFRKDLTPALPATISANPQNAVPQFGQIIKKRPKLVKLPKLTFK
jgi:hypothetical protein